MCALLAVDLGIRTGLAFYDRDGRLRRYRSQNFGSAARLRRAVPRVMEEDLPLDWLVLEGGGLLARIWEREADRRGVGVLRIHAEAWRERLLHPRERRSGRQAKEKANALARKVIAWSGAPLPTSLRTDAAEAILVGLWGVLHTGWLADLPPELRT